MTYPTDRRRALKVAAAVILIATACQTGSTGSARRFTPSAAIAPGSPASIGAVGVAGAGSMHVPRAVATATTLKDGRVLVAGGCARRGCPLGTPGGATAELFDPRTGTFALTGRMDVSRDDDPAVLLGNGRVLLAGGWGATGVLASTDIFDPRTGRFSPGPDMHTPRAGFTAIRLRDGRVLLAGGFTANEVTTRSAELFDPRTGSMTPVGDMVTPRGAYGATLLDDGRVLFVGGRIGRRVVSTAEIFDPATGAFSRTGSLPMPVSNMGIAALPDGRVLVIGGTDSVDGDVIYSGTEIYSPSTGRFTLGPWMKYERYKIVRSVVSLPNGDVVVAGAAPQLELYDAATGAFRTVGGEIDDYRWFMAAAAAGPRTALVVGGYDYQDVPTVRAWTVDL